MYAKAKADPDKKPPRDDGQQRQDIRTEYPKYERDIYDNSGNRIGSMVDESRYWQENDRR